MVIGKPPQAMKRLFPWIAALLFLLIAFAPALGLTHLPLPASDYLVFGGLAQGPAPGIWRFLWLIGMILLYLVLIPGIMYLIVGFFAVLGGLVGERLKLFPSLKDTESTWREVSPAFWSSRRSPSWARLR